MVSDLNDPSGSGFFGKGYWSQKVFWLNVPPQWRRLDEHDYLQRLLNTWGDVGEDLIKHITKLPQQRDPYLVRANSSWTRWFYVTEALQYEDPDFGPVVRLIGEKDYTLMPETDSESPPSDDPAVLSEQFPWFPYEPLAEVARYWQLYWYDAQYEVVNVRARNFDQTELYKAATSLANEIWVKGGDLTLLFNYFSSRDWAKDVSEYPLNGTVQIGTTDGSKRPKVELPALPVRLVKNANPLSGLASDARVAIYMPMQSGGPRIFYDMPDPVDENVGTLREASGGVLQPTVYGTVNYLSGAISIDLPGASVYSSYTPLPIKAKYMVRGYYMLFNAPPTIGYLAKDFGLDNDENDPEAVQRSTIANIAKFWSLKSTAASYRIRGAISLFDVVMEGLYKVCDNVLAALLPADKLIWINDRLYTDVRPIFIKYDHIASDEHFFDYGTGPGGWIQVTDNMLIALDSGRWNGMSIGQSYALDVTQGYYAPISSFTPGVKRGPATVFSVTPLNDVELDALGWQNGYRYRIDMRRCQFEAFNFPKDGSGNQNPNLFALSQYVYNANPLLGTPPNINDTYYYIDKEESAWSLLSAGATPPEDMGRWTVLIQFGAGVASPISALDNVAVRYLPLFDSMSCCYCRSNNMRAFVEVTDEAYGFYNTYEKIEYAIRRLKPKLQQLVPIHARIIQYEVTRRFEDEMFGVYQGAAVLHTLDGSQFVGNIDVEVTVEYRGDADPAIPTTGLDIKLESATAGVIFSYTAWTPPVLGDNDTWVTVVTQTVTLPATQSEVYLYAKGGNDSNYGDVRWTCRVTRRE